MNMRDDVYTQRGQEKDKHGRFYGYEHPRPPLSTFEKVLISIIVGCVAFLILVSASWLAGG